jgi:uncharacterized membrane protein
MFVPGYALLRVLFPFESPLKSIVERGALSLGMSLAVVAIVGLILNYTPWGIRLVPVTVSLFVLTTILATTAVILEYQAKFKQVKGGCSEIPPDKKLLT